MRPSQAASLEVQRRLDEVLAHLMELRATVLVAAAALRHQNGDLDADVACILQRGVASGLGEQMERLRRLGATRARAQL